MHELTQKISQIDDPKLQSSKFMQLLGKLSRGEAAIQGNELVYSNDAQPSS
jgi:hypothetical protein